MLIYKLLEQNTRAKIFEMIIKETDYISQGNENEKR